MYTLDTMVSPPMPLRVYTEHYALPAQYYPWEALVESKLPAANRGKALTALASDTQPVTSLSRVCDIVVDSALCD